MNQPLQIEFLHMKPSAALTQSITEKAEKLAHIVERISKCHVTVQAPHQHHKKGQHFQIDIQLSVPGKLLTVSQNGKAPEHENAHVAVRDAFNSMQRQLKAYNDRQHGLVKRHTLEVPGAEVEVDTDTDTDTDTDIDAELKMDDNATR
jgi:ribosome-associated translation inhibitor RaiA